MQKSFIKNLMAVLFFSLAFSVQAQNSETTENQGIRKKNAIRLNWFPQLAYDRILWQKGKHHIGAMVGTFVLYENYNRGFNFPKETFWRSFSTLSIYHLYGKRNHYLESSFLYGLITRQYRTGEWAAGGKDEKGNYSAIISGTNLNANPDIRRMFEQKEDFVIDNTYRITEYNHWAAVRVGYRYQRPEGGFLFRAGFGFFNYFPNNPSSYPKVYWGIITPLPIGVLFNTDLSLGWSF